MANAAINFKKARLVEHKISYEDLQAENHFSDDEMTFT